MSFKKQSKKLSAANNASASSSSSAEAHIWSVEEMVALVEHAEASTAREKKMWRSALKGIDWSAAPVPEVPGDQCRAQYELIVNKCIRSLTLNELTPHLKDFLNNQRKVLSVQQCVKRPAPPFQVFFSKKLTKLKRQFPGTNALQLYQKARLMYEDLPEETKAKYQARFEEQMQEYRAAAENFKEKYGVAKKPKKDPPPKRPVAPLYMYIREKGDHLKEKHGLKGYREVYSFAAEKFRTLPDHKKAKYVARHKEAMANYARERAEWEARHPGTSLAPRRVAINITRPLDARQAFIVSAITTALAAQEQTDILNEIKLQDLIWEKWRATKPKRCAKWEARAEENQQEYQHQAELLPRKHIRRIGIEFEDRKKKAASKRKAESDTVDKAAQKSKVAKSKSQPAQHTDTSSLPLKQEDSSGSDTEESSSSEDEEPAPTPLRTPPPSSPQRTQTSTSPKKSPLKLLSVQNLIGVNQKHQSNNGKLRSMPGFQASPSPLKKTVRLENRTTPLAKKKDVSSSESDSDSDSEDVNTSKLKNAKLATASLMRDESSDDGSDDSDSS